MRKDYYSILGLTEEEKKLPWDEFEKVIKKKYRKIALESHPDRQTDKSDADKKKAEERFKEATEAYEVLSNKDKKAEYDNPHSNFEFNGGTNFSGMDIDDILRHFGFGASDFGFGGVNFGFGNPGNVVAKGGNIRLKMMLSLDEMYNGVKKKIKYKRKNKCDECDGKGTTSNSKIEKCKHCGGTGRLYTRHGFVQQITTCPYCGGSGKVTINPCPKCGGSGLIDTEQEVEIDIPKGAAQGMQLNLQGYGNAPSNMNGVFGDLVIVLYDKGDEDFIRDGNNLVKNIDVPVVDAILGCNTTVETINGKKLKVKIPQGTEDGYTLRFGGYGMPVYGTKEYGDMYCRVNVRMPKKLTTDEKNVLEELKTKNNFK